jgi:hypothetical protein
VKNRVGAGLNRDHLIFSFEAVRFDMNAVDAERNGTEIKFAVGAGGGLQLKVRIGSADANCGALDREVLCVVDDPMQRGKDRGQGSMTTAKKQNCQKK